MYTSSLERVCPSRYVPWLVEKFIGGHIGEALQNLFSGVLRKPSVEWGTGPQTHCKATQWVPIWAFYYEASCGGSNRSRSQGGTQGNCPQEDTTAVATWHCRQSHARRMVLMTQCTRTWRKSHFSVSLQDPLPAQLNTTLAVKENCFSIIVKRVMKSKFGTKRQQNDTSQNELS